MDLPQSNTETPVYSYTRTELLYLRTKASLISLCTVDRLKDLNIAYHLARRHCSSRGTPRLVCFFLFAKKKKKNEPQ